MTVFGALGSSSGPRPFRPMLAYRAWSQWVALVDGGGYQVKHVIARRDEVSEETAVRVLCEVYSRAIFEVALAMHFDQVDSKVDMEVMLQIIAAFGQVVAEEVYARVGAVGPVVPFSARRNERMIGQEEVSFGTTEHADRAGEAALGEGAESG